MYILFVRSAMSILSYFLFYRLRPNVSDSSRPYAFFAALYPSLPPPIKTRHGKPPRPGRGREDLPCRQPNISVRHHVRQSAPQPEPPPQIPRVKSRWNPKARLQTVRKRYSLLIACTAHWFSSPKLLPCKNKTILCLWFVLICLILS